MPSPFPGMDPYLEGLPWRGFRHDLFTEIRRQLVPKLLPRYYSDTGTHYLVGANGHCIPHSRTEIRDLEKDKLITVIEMFR